jgi:hypothetical protein
VYVVHQAVRPDALDRLLRHNAGLASALICCAALLAGCGGDGSSGSEQRADENPQPTLPVALRYAECSHWREGSVEERQGTIVQIREFAGGPVGSSQGIQKGRVLDDGQAYRLLDNACSKRYATGFRLYLLYTHAAGFAGRPRYPNPLEGGPGL